MASLNFRMGLSIWELSKIITSESYFRARYHCLHSINFKGVDPDYTSKACRFTLLLVTDASVWLARTEQCLEQNGIPRDRGTSVACSFLSDDVYVQAMQLPLTVNERFAEFAKMFAERYSLVESTLDTRAKFIFRRQLPG
ncbi:hypothetical protein T02_12868 [Trichinella nativa]|uniref:Uncharacterized protein n=1 Tax=Trichinella nativa TaxID=6335 RepID=A0A0V1KMB8_9BILA|nr:hypothetical protein T02_12868 [Trichinella nativa]